MTGRLVVVNDMRIAGCAASFGGRLSGIVQLAGARKVGLDSSVTMDMGGTGTGNRTREGVAGEGVSIFILPVADAAGTGQMCCNGGGFTFQGRFGSA